MDMEFHKKLRLLMFQRDVGAREVAQAINDLVGPGTVSPSTVGNWMTGRSSPRLKELLWLAELWDLPIEYLVRDERIEQSSDNLSSEERNVLKLATTVGFGRAAKVLSDASKAGEPAKPGYEPKRVTHGGSSGRTPRKSGTGD